MSHRKVDYRVRPAKSIERKMLVEAFRRLSEFGALNSYQYVGMGSLFFTDFTLVHRSLGIESLISIEDTSDPAVKARFKFNVPFGHIDLRYGHSNTELTKVPWSARSIVWMDYDGTMERSVLRDVEYLAGVVPQGSIILFSVNASSLPKLEEEDGDASKVSLVDRLKQALGAHAVPYETKSSDLSGWGVAKVYREIIDSSIAKALVVRNSKLPPGAKLRYKQLFNFHYSDNAKMLTVGGVIYDAGQEATFAKCAFGQLGFIRPEADAFVIDAPNLTFREMRELDAKLPHSATGLPVPAADVEKYTRTYRYFPRFVEAELS